MNIIHLPNRVDRYSLIKKEIADQQITDVRFWDGISDEILPCRGIAKAHKQIVAWAAIKNHEEILVAEDDVKFTAIGAFQYYIQNKPKHFDIYLGGITWGTIANDNTVTDFSGAMLYMVHRNFYEQILTLAEEKDFDRSLAGLGRYVVCNPMVACQHNGYSDNQGRYVDFTRYFRRKNWFTG